MGDAHVCNDVTSVTDSITGEIVCSVCGLVVSGPGYGDPAVQDSYEPGVSKAYGRHAGTKIGKFDHTGQKVGGYGWLKMRDAHSKPRRQTEVKSIIMLRGACDKLGLPEMIRDNTIDMINACRPMGLTRGLPITAATAGALFIACRQEGIPRTLSEITKTLDARMKLASNATAKIIMLLDLHIEPPDASAYIPRILSEIGAGEIVNRKAREMFAVFKAKRLDISKKPTSFAAAVVYLACIEVGSPITQKKIARAADVTEVGMRNNIKKIMAGCDGIEPPIITLAY